MCRMDEWEEKQVDADLSISPSFFLPRSAHIIMYLHVYDSVLKSVEKGRSTPTFNKIQLRRGSEGSF